MSTKGSLQWVEEATNAQISSFKERRNEHRNNSFWATVATAALAAATTFFIAVGEIYEENIFTVLALASTAVATVVSASDSFFSYRSRWLQSNTTLMRLYALQAEIAFLKTKESFDEPTNAEHFFKKYQDILADANDTWLKTREINDE